MVAIASVFVCEMCFQCKSRLKESAITIVCQNVNIIVILSVIIFLSLLRWVPAFFYFLSTVGDGNSKISSVYINNTHGVDDDDFYDRNLALFEVWNHALIKHYLLHRLKKMLLDLLPSVFKKCCLIFDTYHTYQNKPLKLAYCLPNHRAQNNAAFGRWVQMIYPFLSFWEISAVTWKQLCVLNVAVWHSICFCHSYNSFFLKTFFCCFPLCLWC